MNVLNPHAWQEKLKQMTTLEQIELFRELETEDIIKLIPLLTKDDLAELFHQLDQDTRKTFLDLLSREELIEIFSNLDSDDLVDTLQELPANIVVGILRTIPRDKRDKINSLLKYPEQSVGSLMSIDFISTQIGTSRSEILTRVKNTQGGHEQVSTIYIIDSGRQLLGFIHLVDLIRWPEEDIRDAIEYSVISVETLMDQEEAALLFRQHYLLSMPVVDKENRLVGILTADDIFEVVADEIDEDYLQISGVTSSEETLDTSYLERSVLSLMKDRIFWLLFLMISATLTSYIISYFEAQLLATVALTAYIPMLMDSSGNSGNQASTLITRSLSLRELSVSNWLTILWKEARIGILTGIILATANFGRIMLMDDVGVVIALTVSLTLAFSITLAKMIGSMLPMLATVIKQDPAVMAGPMVTTIVDAVCLLVYFQMASLLL